MQAPLLDALTINEAAETTGWSARMLRYVERIGLVQAERSAAGYRLYGPAELQRLRTLRELLENFDLGLSEIGFALRLRREPQLGEAIDVWLAAEPARPEDVPAADWLRFEQEKHQRLLGVAAPARDRSSTPATTTVLPSQRQAIDPRKREAINPRKRQALPPRNDGPSSGATDKPSTRAMETA